MHYVESKYIAPNGGVINDGLDSVGDVNNLHMARAALLQAGFIHQSESLENTVLTLHGRYLTKEQLNYCDQIIKDNIMSGCDTSISMLNGDSTTVLEENNWKMVEIYGFYLKNGHFALGDYEQYRNENKEKRKKHSKYKGDER